MLRSASVWLLNLCRKHRTKSESDQNCRNENGQVTRVMTIYIVHEFAGSIEVWPAMTGGRLNKGGILRQFCCATGLCSWSMRLKLETITVCYTVAKPFVGISLQIRYVTISDYKSCGHTLCWDLQGTGCKLLLLGFSGFLVCMVEPPMSGGCFASHGAVACDGTFLPWHGQQHTVLQLECFNGWDRVK